MKSKSAPVSTTGRSGSIEAFWNELKGYLLPEAVAAGDRLIAELELEGDGRRALLEALLQGQDLLPVLGGPLRCLSVNEALVQIEEILLRRQYDFDTDRARPFIIDGGANFGLASYWMKQLHPSAEILAFEPDPITAAVFRDNMQTLGWTGVDLREAALGAEAGTVRFHRCLDMPMGSSRSPRLKKKGMRTEMIEVPQISLPEIVAGRVVDFLKLDVEGAEYEIFEALDGRMETIRNMFVEIHFGRGLPQAGLTPLLGVLDRNGFNYMISRANSWPPQQPLMGESAPKGHKASLNLWAKKKTGSN